MLKFSPIKVIRHYQPNFLKETHWAAYQDLIKRIVNQVTFIENGKSFVPLTLFAEPGFLAGKKNHKKGELYHQQALPD